MIDAGYLEWNPGDSVEAEIKKNWKSSNLESRKEPAERGTRQLQHSDRDGFRVLFIGDFGTPRGTIWR